MECVCHRGCTAFQIGKHMFIKDASGETVARDDNWSGDLEKAIDQYLDITPFLRGWGSGKW